jgi:glyoxylase-like metal-dependent hydrolase (beta-lactamase superfamily II)
MIKIQRFAFNFCEENTYIVYDETKEAVVIDCGCMNKEEESLFSSFVKENNLLLKRLLCTHYHIDHIIGNTFIHNTYNLKPEVALGERTGGVPSLKKQAAAFRIFDNLEETEPEKFIAENEEICFGNTCLKALLTPGHSPASLSFYDEISGVVFTGDALFQGSIGRTDLWGGNLGLLISSIRAKLFTLPENTVIYPGHAASSTVGFEKRSNPFFLL